MNFAALLLRIPALTDAEIDTIIGILNAGPTAAAVNTTVPIGARRAGLSGWVSIQPATDPVPNSVAVIAAPAVVPPPVAPVITTASLLPAATVGIAYTQTISGNPAGIVWSVVGRPGWLHLNAGNGQLTGIPGVGDVGSTTFLIRATAGLETTQSFTIQVNAAPAPPVVPTVTTPGVALVPAVVGTAAWTPVALTASHPGVHWHVAGLPAWQSVNSMTGQITQARVPNPGDVGTTTFQVWCSLGGVNSAPVSFTSTVNPAPAPAGVGGFHFPPPWLTNLGHRLAGMAGSILGATLLFLGISALVLGVVWFLIGAKDSAIFAVQTHCWEALIGDTPPPTIEYFRGVSGGSQIRAEWKTQCAQRHIIIDETQFPNTGNTVLPAGNGYILTAFGLSGQAVSVPISIARTPTIVVVDPGQPPTGGGNTGSGNNNPPPAPPAQPGGQGGQPMSIATLVSLWTTDPNPAGLIAKLDNKFDNGFAAAGGQSDSALRVPAGSVVWTNTHLQPISLVKGGTAGPDKWVPLKHEGGWGVFYAYDDLVMPSGGRYIRTDRFLDPCRDLQGWGACR